MDCGCGTSAPQPRRDGAPPGRFYRNKCCNRSYGDRYQPNSHHGNQQGRYECDPDSRLQNTGQRRSGWNARARAPSKFTPRGEPDTKRPRIGLGMISSPNTDHSRRLEGRAAAPERIVTEIDTDNGEEERARAPMIDIESVPIPRRSSTARNDLFQDDKGILVIKSREEETRDVINELLKLDVHERIDEYQKMNIQGSLSISMPDCTIIASIPTFVPLPNESARFEAAIHKIKSTTLRGEDAMYSRFLSRLQYCLPIFIGFQGDLLNPTSNDTWCYCPCSSYMKSWRELFDVVDIVPGDCKFKGPKQPKALLDHLSKGSQLLGKDQCESSIDTNILLHTITFEFLREIYKDYYGWRSPHIAFAKNGKEKKAAEKARNQMVERLNQERDRLQRIEQENHQELQESLQRKNEKQMEELSILREMKRRMDIDIEELGDDPVAPALRKQYGRLIGKTISEYREQYSKPGLCTKIHLCQKFDLNKLFSKWSSSKSKDLVGLFSDLSWSNSGGCEQLQKLVGPWKIVYEGNYPGKDSAPEDDGGPTRAFFDSVWKQAVDLKCKITKNAEIKLFELCEDGFYPASNDMIECTLNTKCDVEKRKVKERIQKYYRAFGRIMAHCMMGNLTSSDKDAPPLSIGGFALPHLYRNAVFRSIEPKDDDYSIPSLSKHVFHLAKYGVQQKYSNIESVIKMLGIHPGCNPIETRKDFRENAQERFIDNRSIAINAMREGLTLGGAFRISDALQFVPLAEVSARFFAKPSISVSDFFHDDGTHRILKRAVVGSPRNSTIDLVSKNHDRVMDKLADIIVREKDTYFLQNFVTFATAQSFVPDLDYYPKYRIVIEFNFEKNLNENSLPFAITCENTLKIPGYVYGGNLTTLEDKLMEAIGGCSYPSSCGSAEFEFTDH